MMQPTFSPALSTRDCAAYEQRRVAPVSMMVYRSRATVEVGADADCISVTDSVPGRTPGDGPGDEQGRPLRMNRPATAD